MVAEIPRFQRSARELLRAGDADLPLRDWLAQRRFSTAFVERLIVPQVSAVWSAQPASLSRFPALFLAQFFDNHGMLGLRHRPRWRTVTGGSASYLGPLTAGFRDRVRVDTAVERVTRDGDGGGVQVKARGLETESFDRVVIASHSDQALALLGDATPQEQEILGAIPYQPNEVVLHTDQRQLPRRRRAWASWNYRLLEPAGSRTAVTYHLNRLQGLDSEQQFCVSLNLSEHIDPASVLRRLDWSHPVYTPQGIQAQGRVAEISGSDRTHFCGAYWGWGFHEDGVNSALRVAQELRVCR
jgi:predicted NAD/FAD-binding protein